MSKSSNNNSTNTGGAWPRLKIYAIDYPFPGRLITILIYGRTHLETKREAEKLLASNYSGFIRLATAEEKKRFSTVQGP